MMQGDIVTKFLAPKSLDSNMAYVTNIMLLSIFFCNNMHKIIINGYIPGKGLVHTSKDESLHLSLGVQSPLFTLASFPRSRRKAAELLSTAQITA